MTIRSIPHRITHEREPAAAPAGTAAETFVWRELQPDDVPGFQVWLRSLVAWESLVTWFETHDYSRRSLLRYRRPEDLRVFVALDELEPEHVYRIYVTHAREDLSSTWYYDDDLDRRRRLGLSTPVDTTVTEMHGRAAPCPGHSLPDELRADFEEAAARLFSDHNRFGLPRRMRPPGALSLFL